MQFTPILRSRLWICLLLLGGCSRADSAETVRVRYVVRPVPTETRVLVDMHISGLAGMKTVRLQMPRWSPGDYSIQEHGKFVQELPKSDRTGNGIWKRVDSSTWEAPASPSLSFRYTISNTPPGNFSENLKVTDRFAFYNGAAVYLYVVDHKNAPSTVSFDLPEGWKHVTPLEASPPREGMPAYSAPDYDVLADSPVVLGDVVTREFTSFGRPHIFAFFNRHQGMDYDSFAGPVRKVVEEQNRMMGGPPYRRYVFFVDVGGRGGGLEHLNSTRIGWNARSPARNIVGLAAHEFFHLWNVKRIRPISLGPFDYIDPPKTRNLWFVEGVTSYYGELTVLRAGLSDLQPYLNSIARSIGALQANPARRRVTADEASLRVWETRFSEGFGGLSYYHKGELIGLCLDLKLRGVTGSRASLDDVMRDMLARYALPKPGYPEDGIRDAVIRAGGAEMGPFYDLLARSTEEMPFEECLAYAGLQYHRSPTGSATILPNPAATPEQIALRASWLNPHRSP